MPRTRQLLHEEITYSVAKDKEQQFQFFSFLENHDDWIQAIVAYHLNLPVNACQVAHSGDWLYKSCNVCIPVTVSGLNPKLQPGSRVLVHFPLPYRVGEFSKPGNSDEKVRCEAGTYAWLEEHCPDIPIPRHYGFGMGTGETFTWIENLPLISHWIECFHRTLLLILHHPIHSRYVRCQYRPRRGDPKIPYLLIEYIEESQGRMLSYNDSRLQNKLNAVNDMPDFLYQASCLATMQTVFPLFFQRHLRRGPFVFLLTDLHPSNIFVDENWCITSLVDLEYACSLPIEMVHPPYWFTTLSVDRIEPEEYDQQRLEFMTVLTEEEERCDSLGKGKLRLSSIMGTAWSIGTFWYSLALTTPSGLFSIIQNQIRPCLIHRPEDNNSEEDNHSLKFMPWYWARNIAAIYGRKVADK
ncbi:hypothetical protein BDW62DRAFT_209623 [Aspergillus aurantiobrunneus]